MSDAIEKITEPGLYLDVPETVYHGDPCPAPSLSSSIVKVLTSESPGHAWWEHPKLNKSKALELERSTKTQGMGTALHKLILGKGRPFKILNFDDYKTKAAREARDAAIVEGATPLLGKEIDKAEEIAEAAKRRIANSSVAQLIGPDRGDPEVTGIWQESNGVWCKMRIDWLPHVAREGGHITVLDLKTTGKSAHEAAWSKTMFDFGGDIQSSWYRRGLHRLIPGTRSVNFVFVVIEQEPPFAVNLCRVGNEAASYADDTVKLAISTWGEALKRGRNLDDWPFFEEEISDIDPPAWRSIASEMQRMRMQNRLAEWQRPINPDKDEAA